MFILAIQLNAQNAYVNVCDHGADKTGQISSSGIINFLIDSLNQNEGGTIFFPAGQYLCGPIYLKSNITLLTDNGATIKFTDNFDDYLPFVQSQWEGVRVKNFASQIYATGANNIAIKGDGHFEGNGQKWWDYWYEVSRNGISDSKWQQIFKNENKDLLNKNAYILNMKMFLRPPMVMFYQCKNITIEGVSFSNPPFWTIVPTYCENVTIHNITIENPGHSPNTDGIDPCSCRNVRISDSHISVGDDCIVLKSGRDEDGRDAGMPTENIAITNCTMLNGHGGVVIGSEMSGDVKRVAISNCIFEGTDRGIRLKSMRGRGGIIEDVRVSNIIMRKIVNEGIMINMRYHQTPVEELSERTPMFQRIHFANINIVEAEKGIAIYGLEERNVEQLSFTDLYIEAQNGVYGQYAQNLTFDNVRIQTPASNAFELDQCKNTSINAIQLMEPADNSCLVQLNNCSNLKISNCFQPEALKTFLRFDNASEKIYLINNLVNNNKKLLDGPDTNKIIQINTIKQEPGTNM